MKKLVISNRGEIARRILRAARRRGYLTAVVSTPSDRDALVCHEADAVLEVSNFLCGEEIIARSKAWEADLLHPGYGFLSESEPFVSACEQAGIRFVGPSRENMRIFGSKEEAKRFAMSCDVPVLPSLWSHELDAFPADAWEAQLTAHNLHLPLLVKATFGGGGRGLRIVSSVEELHEKIARSRSEAQAGFGDGTVFVEQYVPDARHIEVQIFGDGLGGGVVVGDRECSVQRKYQKIIEEAPAPNLSENVRCQLADAALQLMSKSAYRGAGTVEFLVNKDASRIFFLEVNTRLQVEHTVTEEAFGVDLVQAQLDLAEGNWPTLFAGSQPLQAKSSAIEVRVLAEDPRHQFRPVPGPLIRYREPHGPFVRIDSGVTEKSRVNPEFDSLIAKVIASGISRNEARIRLLQAVENMVVHGPGTNLGFLANALQHHDFSTGQVSTQWVEAKANELTAPRLPVSLLQFFATKGFCEQVSMLLCGGSPSAAGAFSARFCALSNSYLRVGSPFDEAPYTITLNDLASGSFEVRGPALAQALRQADSSSSLWPETLRRVWVKAEHDSKNVALQFVATRVSQTEICLSLLGETWTIQSPRHSVVQQSEKTAGTNEIRAPMAGKVIEVHVNEGAKVTAGQLLFVIESMKMQFDIRTDCTGTLEKICVQGGQVLTGPDLLALLQTDGEK